MTGPFAKVPAQMILDTDGAYTLLERRLYEFLDLKAGTRGYWDDSIAGIAETLRVSRRHLGEAAKRLEEKGMVIREKRGHWRTRFVVVLRLAASPQLPLDEHPPEVGGRGEPSRRPLVSREVTGGEPVRRSNERSHLYSNKEPLPRRRSHAAEQADRMALFRSVVRREWPA